MNYQATKNLPSFSVLSSAWKFLELSWLRVLFLAIAWLFVGSLIFKSGGYNAIETNIAHGLESTLFFFIDAIIYVLTPLFFAGLFLLFRRSGASSNDDLIYDPMHSYHSSNIYHTDE